MGMANAAISLDQCRRLGFNLLDSVSDDIQRSVLKWLKASWRPIFPSRYRSSA